jgi:hypothetical protein
MLILVLFDVRFRNGGNPRFWACKTANQLIAPGQPRRFCGNFMSAMTDSTSFAAIIGLADPGWREAGWTV